MKLSELDRGSIDHVLSTTRAVRRRLDLQRPVPLDVVHECLQLAVQAPTGFNLQNWRWLVVTDPHARRELGAIYRRSLRPFIEMMDAQTAADDETTRRVSASSWHLAEHLHEVPVHVVPCTTLQVTAEREMWAAHDFETDLWNMAASSVYGEVWPAAWSFMLALRARGLGSSLTMIHLAEEQEAARLLDIPEGVSQAGLIPVAYFTGQDFAPGHRRPVRELVFHDRWGQAPTLEAAPEPTPEPAH